MNDHISKNDRMVIQGQTQPRPLPVTTNEMRLMFNGIKRD